MDIMFWGSSVKSYVERNEHAIGCWGVISCVTVGGRIDNSEDYHFTLNDMASNMVYNGNGTKDTNGVYSDIVLEHIPDYWKVHFNMNARDVPMTVGDLRKMLSMLHPDNDGKFLQFQNKDCKTHDIYSCNTEVCMDKSYLTFHIEEEY